MFTIAARGSVEGEEAVARCISDTVIRDKSIRKDSGVDSSNGRPRKDISIVLRLQYCSSRSPQFDRFPYRTAIVLLRGALTATIA